MPQGIRSSFNCPCYKPLPHPSAWKCWTWVHVAHTGHLAVTASFLVGKAVISLGCPHLPPETQQHIWFIWNRGSQLGEMLFPRPATLERLVVSADMAACHTARVLTADRGWRPRMLWTSHNTQDSLSWHRITASNTSTQGCRPETLPSNWFWRTIKLHSPAKSLMTTPHSCSDSGLQ